ncbi:MAG: hypothetical protein NTY05_03570 [Rhodocyclales bacterium]|nr:hypothetical protein [Rhodocyclales bacterium]
MDNWKKVVLSALTGLGVTFVAHAYGPGNPAQLNAVPPGFTECAVDGGVCKVPAGATAYVVYGTNGKFATAQGTGDFTCLPKGWVATPSASKPQDLGIPDPVPNVQKKCYLQAKAPAPVAPPAAVAQGKKACFWMSNTPGNPWVASPMPAPDEAACKRLDSCSPDGGKASGGGCYKWTSAEELNKPAPKMACYWMDSAPPNLWKPSPMPAPDQAACKHLDSCSPDGGKASGGGCYVWAAEEQVKGENAKKTAAPPPPPVIKVQHADYGQNCAGKGKPDSNIKGTDPTKHIAAACDGKGTCDYKVDHTAIGDPVFGCRKEYVVQYHCGTGQPKKAAVAPEASGQMAKLDCTK